MHSFGCMASKSGGAGVDAMVCIAAAYTKLWVMRVHVWMMPTDVWPSCHNTHQHHTHGGSTSAHYCVAVKFQRRVLWYAWQLR
jgi:hypothetical protein